MTDTQTTIIDNHDTGGGRYRPVSRVSREAEQVTSYRATEHPRAAPLDIECEIAEQPVLIDQYTLVECASRSRHGRASSLNHQDRLLFSLRDGDRWGCVSPVPVSRPAQGNSDYRPTQLEDVSVTDVHSRPAGSPGQQATQKHRYKVTRDVVEAHDDVWMVEYRRETGGSRSGSNSRTTNATATRLEEPEQ